MDHAFWQAFRQDPSLALRGPADTQVLAQAEQALGHPLPTALRDVCQHHDGQHPAGRPLFQDEYRWLSVRESLREWQTWQAILARPDMADMRHTHGSCGAPEATVRMDWWNEHWWPIAVSALGDLLCIDGQPGPQGQLHQIIEVSSAHEGRERVADSLGAMLGDAAADLAGDA